MNQERLDYLLDRYRQDLCTEAEKEELDNWFHAHNPGTESMRQWEQESGGLTLLTEELLQDFNRRTQTAAAFPKKPAKMRWSPKIGVAAAASALVAVTSLFLLTRPHEKKAPDTISSSAKPLPIQPGGNKAILTLANGSTIILNDAQQGQLARQNNTQINKVDSGRISYRSVSPPAGHHPGEQTAVAYNTMTTPRGGKYALTLADGTEVTLDASSSITFPVAFTGKLRQVSITGQAWFKVAHNPQHPFSVLAKGQTIHDIGTAFNINAYKDEASIKITLIEGSVRVSNTQQNASLSPGQQAEIMDGQENITIRKANVEEAIAWKDGWFVFHNETINNVMTQAARWYDIDVAYEGDEGSRKFGGSISRYQDLSQLLENLRIVAGIHYNIQGRKVTITK